MNNPAPLSAEQKPCRECQGTGKLTYSNTGATNDCVYCGGFGTKRVPTMGEMASGVWNDASTTGGSGGKEKAPEEALLSAAGGLPVSSIPGSGDVRIASEEKLNFNVNHTPSIPLHPSKGADSIRIEALERFKLQPYPDEPAQIQGDFSDLVTSVQELLVEARTKSLLKELSRITLAGMPELTLRQQAYIIAALQDIKDGVGQS